MPKPVEVTLPSDREVRVVRTFNAPRKLVWDAHTKPELVQKWMFGPPGWTMPVCEMDVRVGGSYRWRWRSQEDKKEMGFFGEYREVDAPNRMVYAESYDPGTVGGPTSGGRQPGWPNTARRRSQPRDARTFRAMSAKTCTLAQSGFQLASGFVIP